MRNSQTYNIAKYVKQEYSIFMNFLSGDASAIIGLQGALKFNGGGNINHSIFWQNLCPEKDSGEPEGALLEAINRY